MDCSQLRAWLEEDHLPEWMDRTGAALCVGFTPRPLPVGSMPFARAIAGGDRRLTLMWFLDDDPRCHWDQTWSSHAEVLTETGGCTLALCAPFVPTVPGTDRYVDQLRSTPSSPRRITAR
jgi:hypothetical protein